MHVFVDPRPRYAGQYVGTGLGPEKYPFLFQRCSPGTRAPPFPLPTTVLRELAIAVFRRQRDLYRADIVPVKK